MNTKVTKSMGILLDRQGQVRDRPGHPQDLKTVMYSLLGPNVGAELRRLAPSHKYPGAVAEDKDRLDGLKGAITCNSEAGEELRGQYFG